MSTRDLRRSRLLAGPFALAVMATSTLLVGASGPATAATCSPLSDRPTLVVEEGPSPLGGTVLVTGEGWCNDVDGGSVVALKIDEGGFSRLDDSIHKNRTIWALAEADQRTGSLNYELRLPDGTTATSAPAFADGTHSLRALTGSIKAGDPVRSVLSNEFVVGEHRPTGVPTPIELSELTPALGRTLVTRLDGDRLTVDVDGGREGDWVFLSLLTPDGSARYPWGARWWQLDAAGRVEVGAGDDPVQGAHRLVVQNGNREVVGDLLGWSSVTWPTNPGRTPVDGPSTSPTPKKDPKKSGSKKPGTSPTPPVTAPTPGITPPAQVPAPALPGSVPGQGTVDPATAVDRPVRSGEDLQPGDQLVSTYDAPELSVRTAAKSSQLFVHLYQGSSSVAAGWVNTDAEGVALLDLRDVADGTYRLTFSTQDATLAGWTEANLAAATSSVSDADQPRLVAAAATDDEGPFTEQDGWLAGMAAALLVGLGLGSASRARTTSRSNA